MDLSQVLCVGICLHHRNFFSARLHNCGGIGSSNSLRIGVSGIGHRLTCIQESVRVTTDDDVHLRAVLGYLLILLVTRVTQGDDDVDALSFQLLGLRTGGYYNIMKV